MLKESEIKLFGWKISLPENGTVVSGGEYSDESSNESSNGSGGSVDCDRCLKVSRGHEGEGVRGKGHGEEKQQQGDEVKSLEFSHTTHTNKE